MPTPQEIQDLLERYKETGQSGVEPTPTNEQLQDLGEQLDAGTKKLQQMTAANKTTPTSNNETVEEEPIAQMEYEPKEQETTLKDELARANAFRNQSQFLNNLNKAATTIGAAFSGRKPDYSFYDDLNKQAEQPISDILTKQKVTAEDLANQVKQTELGNAKEKADPKSQVSQLYRKVLTEMGISIGDNATASSIEKAFPAVEKFFQAREANASRQMMREQLNQSKDQANIEKMTKNFNEALDPSKGRAGQFGMLYQNYVQAEKLKALTDKLSSGLNLNPAEMEEFSLGLARLISGSGGSSRAQVEALVPHTMRGNMAKISQWLSNTPQGTQQQEFVKRMLKTVEREQAIAKTQMQQIIAKRAQGYEALRKKDPEAFQRGLESAGLLMDQYEKFLQNKPILNKEASNSEQLNNEDVQAIEWAKNNKDDPRAKEILKLHGLM